MGHTQCCSAAPTDNNCRVHFGCLSPTKKENHQLASRNVYIILQVLFHCIYNFQLPVSPRRMEWRGMSRGSVKSLVER